MAEKTPLSARARNRLGWIIFYAENECSVTETCQKFNIARSTFYRTVERFDRYNLQSLEDDSQNKRLTHHHAKEAVHTASDENTPTIVHQEVQDSIIRVINEEKKKTDTTFSAITKFKVYAISGVALFIVSASIWEISSRFSASVSPKTVQFDRDTQIKSDQGNKLNITDDCEELLKNTKKFKNGTQQKIQNCT